MILFFLIALFILTPTANAAHMTGNGGDVLVCETKNAKQKSTLEMLDLFEAKTLHDLELQKTPSGATTEQIIDNILQRVSKLNPTRAALYKNWQSNFINEANFLKNVDLTDIPDSQHIAIPRGCAIRQIAIQTTPDAMQTKRYTIDDDLWRQMDSLNRAVLIVHELVYREALSVEHVDSKRTRVLVGLLFSTRTYSQNEYLQTIANLGFVTADYKNLLLRFSGVGRKTGQCDSGSRLTWRKPSHPEFYRNRQLKSAEVDCGSEIELNNQKIGVLGTVEFYEGGTVKSFTPVRNIRLMIPSVTLVAAQAQVELYENGQPQQLTLAESVSDKNKSYYSGSKIRIDSSGNIQNQ